MTLVTYDPDTRREICSLLGIRGSTAHITLLFKLAEHYQLDVLTKEIALIPERGPFIGVWGRLHIAHRSTHLDGLELDDEWETDRHYHVRAVVWRNDMGHPAAKVIGRVGKDEGTTDRQTGEFKPKEWPYEIARARALRAGLGFGFNIHDSFDGAEDNWAPPPDERVTANGTVIDSRQEEPENSPTGEVLEPAPPAGEPRTLVVGGHSLAQKIAILASYAGIDDDETRHGIIRVLTRGQYQRGTDIPKDAPQELVDHILEGFEGIGDGSLYYRCNPDGTVRGVYKTATDR